MNKFIQAFVLLIAFAFATTPLMAKEESKSTKAKSSEVKKAKKEKKEKKEKKTKAKKESTKKGTDSKSTKSAKKDKDSKSKTASSTKKKKDAETKESTTAKKEKDKDSAKSTKSSTKKSTKSGMTGTDKAKQFKNVTVNINKADAATLSHYLVGIGETRAKDIVKYRKKAGKFKSIDDLMQVPGIGEGIFAGLKKNVSTSKGESSVPKKK